MKTNKPISDIDASFIKEQTNGFRQSLYNAMKQFGFKRMSEERACELLAYLYVFGNDTNVVMNDRLRNDIFEAQNIFNAHSGERARADLIKLFQSKVRDLEKPLKQKNTWFESLKDYLSKEQWFINLKNEYNLQPC